MVAFMRLFAVVPYVEHGEELRLHFFLSDQFNTMAREGRPIGVSLELLELNYLLRLINIYQS